MKEEASETPEKRVEQYKSELKKLCSDHGVKYEDAFSDKLINWKVS